MSVTTFDQLSTNALRVLAMDGVQKAHSGHPGMPMGTAEIAYVLWSRHLKHNPHNPRWINRDRFILSAGHGSILLYSLLYLTGYPLSLDDLKQFRQWGSKTPGHPEYAPELGIETTTGPLGQGFVTGVGMAVAQAHLAARFNRPGYAIFDNYVYAIVSDGELMEGVSHEAASFAGCQALERLIYFYDDNDISIEGSTDITFTEDVPARFRAYHWHVQEVDGHDIEALDAAVKAAQAAKGQPHLIICHTHLAYGSPNKHDTPGAHGSPLGQEEIRLTKEALGWPSQEPFFVPEEVLVHYRTAITRGAQAEASWRDLLTHYEREYPIEGAELKRLWAQELPADWESALPVFQKREGPLSTRAASGRVLNALSPIIPELLGGSADLAPSNNTTLHDLPFFQPESREGRNFHFGVREHAMGGILNGMALYGGLKVYGGTFLVFSDYMRPAVRLAALMGVPVTYVWTHDSIFLGEDGPTHQPVEQLLSLRAIPNLTVIRPADANEAAAAWRVALTRTTGPVALLLSRQKLPILEATKKKVSEGVACGAYILSESAFPRIDIILIATGSEVSVALEVQRILAAEKIGARVVSMPSWKLFDAQSIFYRLNVLPPDVKRRLAIEAGVTLGWERYTGEQGTVVGLDTFGASAPYQRLKEEFGFAAERIAARARDLMKS
ncbi:MAG TPA: transketolase [Thermoflexia bacterium]|nr:transketolase [Thermoflexia bacterium]